MKMQNGKPPTSGKTPMKMQNGKPPTSGKTKSFKNIKWMENCHNPDVVQVFPYVKKRWIYSGFAASLTYDLYDSHIEFHYIDNIKIK